MVALGPLDRRTLRKRCVACTRRKIKCEGGPPCLYCKKKRQKCVPQAVAARTSPVFVNVSAAPSAGGSALLAVVQMIQTPPHGLCSNVSLNKSSQFINHFFSGFLASNEFGGELDLDTIIGQFQNSSSLYHASIAVGALDLSKKRLFRSVIEVKNARLDALTAYRTSISDFQTEIGSKDFQSSPANLWTTLILGLFELMFDETGEGFVKHILYGTSKILQLRGPEAHLSGPGRSFFLTVRAFEICRALIYSEPTFLCEPAWVSLMQMIWKEDLGGGWHPKEALFDLMITCSSLSHRVREILRPDSSYPAAILNDALHGIAVEGLSIRTALNDWYISFQRWPECTGTSATSPPFLLATIYFNAISIYLSGIFDYRFEFSHIIAPTLSQSYIQNHVDQILSNTQTALNNTKLGGVLFFFPLRVAGARVTNKQEATAIVEMLDEISKRSFVVAEAFTADLKDLWQTKGIQ